MSILLASLAITANAQSNQENEVSQAVEAFRKALVDGDKKVLNKVLFDKLSYGHSNGKVETKDELITKYTDGTYDFVTLDLTEHSIAFSENIAIVRHKLDGKTADAGKPGEAHLYVLMVWQKIDNEWKLVARQAVKQPLPS